VAIEMLFDVRLNHWERDLQRLRGGGSRRSDALKAPNIPIGYQFQREMGLPWEALTE